MDLNGTYNGKMPSAQPLILPPLSPAPSAPNLASIDWSNKDQVRATVQGFANHVAEWEKSLEAVVEGYKSLLSGAASLPDKQLLPDQLVKISEFINIVSAGITESERVLREDELSGRRIVAQLPSRDLKLFAQTQLQKLRTAGIAQHDARVTFYYSLLVVRAEYDPDARGAPSLSNVDEIEAYFKEQLKG
jgi:hypothetical protein